MTTAKFFYGWILLAVLWLVFAFNLGFPAYGGPLINTAMADAIGMSRSSLGLITAFYIIMSGLPGPLVAMAVNRFGPRNTLVLGSLLNVTGAVFMATIAESATHAYIGFGFIIGGGVCAGAAIASQTAVARWFVRRRAMAMSVLYSAGAIGGYVATKLVLLPIIRTQGWRGAWWLIAGLAAVAGVLALLFVKNKPEDLGQVPDGEVVDTSSNAPKKARPAYITENPWEFRDAVRKPVYWLILATLVGGSGGFTFFLAHGIVMLRDMGHDFGVGAGAISTMTWTGLLAKAVIIAFGDRLDPRWLWAVFMTFFGAGLVIMVDARTQTLVTVFAGCLGIGFGGGIVCLMTVLGNYFGLKAFALLSGIAIAINTTLSAAAPWVAGRLFDQGIPYTSTCYFLAGWCFLGALVLALIRRPIPTAQSTVTMA
jgi:cyanate permease